MEENEQMSQPQALNKPNLDEFFVVGIGASAGGLTAIKKFLDKLPKKFNHPIVVVQHLSPDYKSHMKELLTKNTHLKIVEVKRGISIKPGHLYLMVPNTTLTVRGNLLIPEKRDENKTINHPINQFFTSLAYTFQQNAIAVIFSGTGTDGTEGILSINEFGGKVLVQEPKEADFNGMPISAINSSVVDHILPLEFIGSKLLKLTQDLALGNNLEEEIDRDEESFQRILLLIKVIADLDFSGYKKSTISRRIANRINKLGFDSLEQYVNHLGDNHEEVFKLAEDFLVGVTRFFRDPDLWSNLEQKILPEIIEKKKPGQTIRVMSVGCSSGEEVFSVAMVLETLLKNKTGKIAYKIFANDLSKSRIKKASRATFGSARLEEIPKNYHEYLIKNGHKDFQISDTIRRKIVFSNYNFVTATPMSNMDLILCRNMLIYFKPILQEKAINIFRFSLVSGGFLVLGQSESIQNKNQSLKVYDTYLNIYTNTARNKLLEEIAKQSTEISNFKFREEEETYKATNSKSFEFLPNLLNDTLIEMLKLAAIYITGAGAIIRAKGNFRRFLELPESGFSNNIFDLLPFSFLDTFREALTKAIKNGISTKIQSISLPQMPDDQAVDIYFHPFLLNKNEDKAELLLIFLPTRATMGDQEVDVVKIQHVKGFQKEKMVQKLQQELKQSRMEISTLQSKLDINSEELQTSNEELMATNEELQSANEELQSVNEELYAVNSELNQKLSDLSQANDDIDNLLNSSKIEVILLDREMCIRKTTPFIERHFDFTTNDLGRPLYQINHKFKNAADDLYDLCKRVINTGKSHQKELQDNHNFWFIQRINPFINAHKEIAGAIVAYVDITEIKQLYESNKELERFAYVASHDLQEPLRNILDFVNLFKEDYASSLDDTALQYLQFMNEAANRMGNLVKDILSYSRIGVRSVDEPVNLSKTLDNVLADLRKKIDDKKADVVITGKMPIIKGHPMEFHSLFLNLIGNALKFVATDKNPEIRVTATKQEHNYLFSIIDNGIGIPDNQQDKIFQIFKRLHNSNKYRGTGIGLAHCKKIVEQHDGTIWVESVVGKGSTFYFTLKI